MDKSSHIWFNGLELFTHGILLFIIIINYSTPTENVAFNLREQDLNA